MIWGAYHFVASVSGLNWWFHCVQGGPSSKINLNLQHLFIDVGSNYTVQFNGDDQGEAQAHLRWHGWGIFLSIHTSTAWAPQVQIWLNLAVGSGQMMLKYIIFPFNSISDHCRNIPLFCRISRNWIFTIFRLFSFFEILVRTLFV